MATTETERKAGKKAKEEGTDAESSGGLRQSASEAYETAKARTSEAYGNARQQAAQKIDTNPFGMLIGGFAVGAIIAGLLPRTRQETRALGEVGGKVNQSARDAIVAARDAGREKLDELGLNRDGLSERLGEFASSAGTAIRKSRRGGNGQ